ncbi:MAG: acyl-CoA desaturase, partial [Chitinophagales bacterium]|nr:acyl-CoA desaturase [Chitinophagales bacterium]
MKSKRFDIFKTDLNNKVRDYIKANGRHAGAVFWLKAILLLFTWALLYVYIVFISADPSLAFVCSLLWGVTSLFIIFNIGHDAVHEVISKKKWVNNIMRYSFNLVGGNAYS